MGRHEGIRAGADQAITQPDPAAFLGWLPVASLVLGADGSAKAVNSAWTALSEMPEHDSLGQGWLGAVVPAERDTFGARVRLAAARREAGQGGCHLGPAAGGQWTRWWWQPALAEGLLCVAVGEEGRDRAGPGSVLDADIASAAIHRIFGVGLILQSAADLADRPVADRIWQAVDELDDLIGDIRDAVFRSRPAARTQ